MASITINIPNDKVDLVLNAMGYQDTVEQINEETGERETVANPISKAQHAKDIYIAYTRNLVKRYEKTLAQNAVAYTDLSDVD